MTNQAMEHVPTRAERFWRALGFRHHLGDEPDDTGTLSGWSRTEIRLDFSWADRLRLLLTGSLRISSIQYTDTPSPAIVKNRLDWKINAPGDRT